MAIRNSGLIFGTIGLIIIAAICVYCMSLLVHAAHRVCITIKGLLLYSTGWFEANFSNRPHINKNDVCVQNEIRI